MQNKFFLAIGILAGTVIGAGIFSLPYIVGRLGWLSGLFFVCMFAGVYFVLHRMYAALLLTADGLPQFGSLAQRYLPPGFRTCAKWLIPAELICVMAAYLILAPSFFHLMGGENTIVWIFIFWAVASFLMFVKLKWVGIVESVGVLAVIAIVLILLFFAGGRPFSVPIVLFPDWTTLLLSIGPLLFAFSGRPAIAAVVALYKEQEASGPAFSLKKVIAWGAVIPFLVYGIFITSILRLSSVVTADAVSGLLNVPAYLLFLLGGLGLIGLWTSYFIIGIDVKNILTIDFRIRKWASAGFAVGLPLVLYMAGIKNFLPLLGFTGGVLLAFEGILIVWMWRRAFPEHAWRHASWLLMGIFVLAIGYEIVHLLA